MYTIDDILDEILPDGGNRTVAGLQVWNGTNSLVYGVTPYTSRGDGETPEIALLDSVVGLIEAAYQTLWQQVDFAWLDHVAGDVIEATYKVTGISPADLPSIEPADIGRSWRSS